MGNNQMNVDDNIANAVRAAFLKKLHDLCPTVEVPIVILHLELYRVAAGAALKAAAER